MSEFDPSQTGNFNHRASSEPFSEWSETTANTYIYSPLSTPIPSRETPLSPQCPTPTPLRSISEATTRPITPARRAGGGRGQGLSPEGLTKLLHCCLKRKDAYLLGKTKQEFYTSVCLLLEQDHQYKYTAGSAMRIIRETLYTRRAELSQMSETGKLAEQRDELKLAIDSWIAIDNQKEEEARQQKEKKQKTAADVLRDSVYQDILAETSSQRSLQALDNGLEAPVTPRPPPRSPQYSLQDKTLDRLTDLVEREFKRDSEPAFEVTGKIESLSSDVQGLKRRFDDISGEISSLKELLLQALSK